MALLLLAGTGAGLASDRHPLEPPDRSSPRAALETFLSPTDSLATFVTEEYAPSPTLAEFRHMVQMSTVTVGALDLSHIPPSARRKFGGAAALALYDTLNRIELPRPSEIPGPAQLDGEGENALANWVVPHTEIALVRVTEGPREGQYLFSHETVVSAADYLERAQHLPLKRRVAHAEFGELPIVGGGWPVRLSWIQS